eukprot:7020192-Heterocapsa_arctica.AAC.1
MFSPASSTAMGRLPRPLRPLRLRAARLGAWGLACWALPSLSATRPLRGGDAVNPQPARLCL